MLLLATLLTLTPHSAQLVQWEEREPPRRAFRELSLIELRVERARLLASQPSFGGPVTMLAVGVGLSLIGLPTGIFSTISAVSMLSAGQVLTAGSITAIVFIGIGVVMLAIGIPLLIAGAVGLRRAVIERRAISAQVEEIDALMKPPEDSPPRPRPPPVPSHERVDWLSPTLRLARF